MSLALYHRLAPQRRSANMLNALHIALENRMTPAEAAAIATAMAGAADDDLPVRPNLADRARRFAADQARFLATAGKAQPEPFTRHKLGRRMLFLQGAPGPRADRTLILCFAGRSDRLNMPLPPFLQHLDAGQTDVALVMMPRKADPDGYRRGFGDLGSDILACIDALAARVGHADYRRTLCFGTSGGGLPAIATALRLGLPRVLAAVPTDPFDPRWSGASGETAATILTRLFTALPPARRPAIDLAYSSDHTPDRDAAVAIGRILPVRHYDIRLQGVPGFVPHMVLGFAMLAGQLGPVLRDTLLAPDGCEGAACPQA